MFFKEMASQMPEARRFTGVDVTSDAQRQIIIPTLRHIMRIDPHNYMSPQEKLGAVVPVVGENIAMPIWGNSLKGLFYPRGRDLVLTQPEFESETDHLARATAVSNMSIHNRFVVGELPTMLSPRISDSLLVSNNVLLGEFHGSNHPELTADHITAIAQLSGGLVENNRQQVINSLQEINDGLIDNYTASIHGHLFEEEQARYQSFGELAGTARAIDSFWFPALRQNTSDILLENSVALGSNVIDFTLGGTIRNCIVASNISHRRFSHVVLDNVYFLTADGVDDYFPPGGYVGNPEAASKAAALARDLPEFPLADFAARAA